MSDLGREIIEASVGQSDFTRADILRRAFWHYASTNPENNLSYPSEERDFGDSKEINNTHHSEQDSVVQGGSKHPVTGTGNKESGCQDVQASTTEHRELLKGVYDPMSEPVET